VIRWHERDAFELRFVPTRPPGVPAPHRRLRDAPALERLLTQLGLPRDRVVDVLTSPYVLHSLRVTVDRRTARRTGLIEPAPVAALRRWLGRRSD